MAVMGGQTYGLSLVKMVQSLWRFCAGTGADANTDVTAVIVIGGCDKLAALAVFLKRSLLFQEELDLRSLFT